MRPIHLVESSPLEVDLTQEEAAALQEAGRRLASDKSWWGAEEDEDRRERTVIRCRPIRSGRYQIRVSDAVGLIAIKDLQVVVQPKIPQSHLLYLLARSGRFPRVEEERGLGGEAPHLWELLATWFVARTEELLRSELIRDYTRARDFLQEKRGRIEPLRTAQAYYAGRIGLECEFDEFNFDTPLNRTLRAGAELVARSPRLQVSLRKRSSRILARMEGVGTLLPSDLRVRMDRRTHHYRDPIAMAHQLLRWSGRSLSAGSAQVWTFLIRTPEMVEDGLRSVIAEGLADFCDVRKQGMRLPGSSLSFNPDLVFGRGQAVADVKYKLQKHDWVRADLYQITAFATAYGTPYGALIGFRESQRDELPSLQVGPSLQLESLSWVVDEQIEPDAAASALTARVRAWVGEMLAQGMAA